MLTQENCPRCGVSYRSLKRKGYSLQVTEQVHLHSCSQCEYCGKYGYLYGINHYKCKAREVSS